MYKPLFTLLTAVFICLSGVAVAAPIIDFEGLTDSDPIGVLGAASFTSAIVATAGQSLNEFEVPPKSGVNVALNTDLTMTVTFFGGVDVVSGFITYVSPVTIDAFGVLGILGSYKSLFSSNLALSGDPLSSPNEGFTFSASELITSLQFISDSPLSFALDDLSFDANGGPGPSPLPEPGSVALLITGLVCLSLRRPRQLLRAFKALVYVFGVGFVITANAQSVMPSLVVYPQNIPLAVPTTVTVTLQITDPTFIQGSAVLNEIDASNRVVRRLATFVDNGQGGDEVADDKRFTAQFIANEPVPRPILIAASVAFTGSLTRTPSPSTLVWAAADTDLRFGFAVAQSDAIVFRDAGGRVASTIPLAGYVESAIPIPSGPATRTTFDTAFVAESQLRVGIITARTLILDSEQEGENESSTFSYYGPSGVLLFALNSSESRTFFVDPQLRYTSRSGNRVILVEVAENETDPSVRLFDDSGTVLAQYSNLPGLNSIAEAQLTSNGRFIGILGDGVSLAGRSAIVIVIDTVTNSIAQRLYDPSSSPPIGLAENINGSFNVIVGETVGEQLP